MNKKRNNIIAIHVARKCIFGVKKIFHQPTCHVPGEIIHLGGFYKFMLSSWRWGGGKS